MKLIDSLGTFIDVAQLAEQFQSSDKFVVDEIIANTHSGIFMLDVSVKDSVMYFKINFLNNEWTVFVNRRQYDANGLVTYFKTRDRDDVIALTKWALEQYEKGA